VTGVSDWYWCFTLLERRRTQLRGERASVATQKRIGRAGVQEMFAGAFVTRSDGSGAWGSILEVAAGTPLGRAAFRSEARW